MEIFIQSIDPGAWNAIVKGPFIPTKIVNDVVSDKDWDEMTDDEKRKVQYDRSAMNILTAGLSSDYFFRIAEFKNAKDVWQSLEDSYGEIVEERKVNIIWEDNASITSSSSEEEDLCLITKTNSCAESESDNEAQPDYDELQDAFIELHSEAQKLCATNKRLKKNMATNVNKLAELQKEVNDLKTENTLLISKLESKSCECVPSSLNMNDYISLQNEFEELKKEFYKERMQLQTKVSFLEDLFKKLNKRNLNVDEYFSLEKHELKNKGLGFSKSFNRNKQNPTPNFRKQNVYSNNFGKICNYCMRRGHTNFNCFVRKFDIPNGRCMWVPKLACTNF